MYNKRTTNGQQRELLAKLMEDDKSITDLMEFFGYKKRESIRKALLNDLLTGGYVEMTHPENPNHRNQRYRITDKGKSEIESVNVKPMVKNRT